MVTRRHGLGPVWHCMPCGRLLPSTLALALMFLPACGASPKKTSAAVTDRGALTLSSSNRSPSGTDSAIGITAPPATASSPPSAAAPTFLLGGHLLYTMDGVIREWDRAGERRLTDANVYCCVLRVSPKIRRLMVMPGTDAVGAVRGGTLSPTGDDY